MNYTEKAIAQIKNLRNETGIDMLYAFLDDGIDTPVIVINPTQALKDDMNGIEASDDTVMFNADRPYYKREILSMECGMIQDADRFEYAVNMLAHTFEEVDNILFTKAA